MTKSFVSFTRSLSLILLASFAGGAQGQETPELIFRDEVRLVYTPFRAVDAQGEPISDLTEREVSILENGVVQPIRHFDAGESQASVVLAIDTSGSMGQQLPLVKSAAREFVAHLAPGTPVAVVTIEEKTTALELSPDKTGGEAFFTTDLNRVRAAIDSLNTSGATAIRDGLNAIARRILPGLPTYKTAIVLLTDGDDNVSRLAADVTTRALANSGTFFFPIVIDPISVHYKAMASFARATGGEAFQIRGLTELSTIYERVANRLNHLYAIGYTQPPGPEKKRRRLEIQVRRPGVTILARADYCPTSACDGDPKTVENIGLEIQKVLKAHPGFAVDRTQETALFGLEDVPPIVEATTASLANLAPATGVSNFPAPEFHESQVQGCVCLDGRAFQVGDSVRPPGRANWRGSITALTYYPNSKRCEAVIGDGRALESPYISYQYRLKALRDPQTVRNLCLKPVESLSATPTGAERLRPGTVVFNLRELAARDGSSDRKHPIPAFTVGVVSAWNGDRATVVFHRINRPGFGGRLARGIGRIFGKKSKDHDWLTDFPTVDDDIEKIEARVAPELLKTGLDVLEKR